MRGKYGTGDYTTGVFNCKPLLLFFHVECDVGFLVIKNVSQNDEEWSCLVSIQKD